MIDLLLLMLFNAFAITGFHLASQEGMILGFLRKWCEKPKMQKAGTSAGLQLYKHGFNISEFWRNPIYDCPTCMASLHSTYFYIPFAIMQDATLLFIYPLYILSLSGMSTLVYRVINKLEDRLQ